MPWQSALVPPPLPEPPSEPASALPPPEPTPPSVPASVPLPPPVPPPASTPPPSLDPGPASVPPVLPPVEPLPPPELAPQAMANAATIGRTLERIGRPLYAPETCVRGVREARGVRLHARPKHGREGLSCRVRPARLVDGSTAP